MNSNPSGTKLFHTVVVLGMSLSACSSSTTSAEDAGTAAADSAVASSDGQAGSDGGTTQDSAIGTPSDASVGGDAFGGWICC